ncbi:MAG: CcmD family protein [Phycisphaerae bacterium]|nr:CcmD family protein [Phycisphaerae bacterium]
MLYLTLAFTVLWAAAFVYLLTLDAKIRDVRRRLHARQSA